MKRVAIPVVGGRLSEYFGQCDHYEIFEINDGNVISEEIEIAPKEYITKLPEWASVEGITDIIVHRIDKRTLDFICSFKNKPFCGDPL